MPSTYFFFILALLLLITIHEFGHFIVARLCGVKVLRFSFGFGPILAKFNDKRGTEYAFSLIPLGGYVKMLDESEEAVSAEDQDQAFNRKSVWARIAIIIAGPLFNFLFAFFAFWLVLVIGIQSLAPIIETVRPDSIAAKAGLEARQEILALDNKPVNSWRDFQFALMPLFGSGDTIEIQVRNLDGKEAKSLSLPLKDWSLDNKKMDPLASLGIQLFIPSYSTVVGEVVADSPSNKAGLLPGDKIKTMNGKPVSDWIDLVNYVQAHPDSELKLTVDRKGKELQFSMTIGQRDGKGFIGLQSQPVNWPKSWFRLQRQPPVQALQTAFWQTKELTLSTFALFGRLITGKLGMENLSGPIGIAQGAGNSGRSGIAYYLSFLALVSISLGALNLLPIPMLDGGQLLYCILEVIRGKPLGDGVKSIGMYIGILLLLGLMILSFGNDISRLLN